MLGYEITSEEELNKLISDTVEKFKQKNNGVGPNQQEIDKIKSDLKKHLEENFKSVDITLTEEMLQDIEDIHLSNPNPLF